MNLLGGLIFMSCRMGHVEKSGEEDGIVGVSRYGVRGMELG